MCVFALGIVFYIYIYIYIYIQLFGYGSVVINYASNTDMVSLFEINKLVHFTLYQKKPINWMGQSLYSQSHKNTLVLRVCALPHNIIPH